MGVKKIVNRIGLKFNCLTVMSLPYKGLRGRYSVDCLCDCGKKTSVNEQHLVKNHTKSCGHLIVILKGTHGFSKKDNKIKRKFYKTWSSLRDRCLNKKNKFYFRYGGTGIKICDRWLGKDGFIHFRDDMYESYLEHIKIYGLRNTTLDRWPNASGNYAPTNCRWATYDTQQNNRRSTPISKDLILHRKFITYFLTELARLIQYKRENSKSKYLKYLGCSLLEFKQYFDSLFVHGMDWDNHGSGEGKWNFGHIVGCNNFDLSKEKDRYECFNYLNLKPEWSLSNKRKRKNKLEVDNILRKEVAAKN